MKHTIEKINNKHWKIDGIINIRYADTDEFGELGWYIEIPGEDYHESSDDFLQVLERSFNIRV